jgi:hypothetical protein
MNKQLMTYGAVGFAAFAVWAWAKSKGQTLGLGQLTGEQQRMQGVDDWMTASSNQFAVTGEAIKKNWSSLAGQFSAQPDFWV